MEHNEKDLVDIKELLESGKIMPVIDGCYPLRKTSEAFWYFEKVHAKGKVVITVANNNRTEPTAAPNQYSDALHRGR